MKIQQLSDKQLYRLVEIAREHTSLAAEYGRKTTSFDRKLWIKHRIDELRTERDAILASDRIRFA